MLPPFIYTLGAYVGAYAEKLKARKPLILRAFLMSQTGVELLTVSGSRIEMSFAAPAFLLYQITYSTRADLNQCNNLIAL